MQRKNLVLQLNTWQGKTEMLTKKWQVKSQVTLCATEQTLRQQMMTRDLLIEINTVFIREK